MQNEISQVITESRLEQKTASAIEEKFLPLFKQAAEWKEKALQLVVTDETQISKMKQAREARLAIKGIRVEADKVRKSLKEDSLRYGKAVQGVYNVIEYLVAPIEEHLEKQEKFIEIQEANRVMALREVRTAEVMALREYIPTGLDLGTIPEEDYQKLLNGAKLQMQAAKAEAERIELDRLQQERISKLNQQRLRDLSPLWSFVPEKKKKDNFGTYSDEDWSNLMGNITDAQMGYEQEQQRIKEENERLKKEAAEKEKQAAAERKKQEEKLKKEREAKEKELSEQRAKLEAERKERERVEAELKAKEEAERKAKADEEAMKEAQLALGDKEKFEQFLTNLCSLKNQFKFKSKKYNTLYDKCNELIDKIDAYAKSKL